MAGEQKQSVVQLAFRTEGQLFNAYLEGTGSPPSIELLGSISIALCEVDATILATWERLMALAVCRRAERQEGQAPQIVGRRTVPVGGSA